MPVAFLLPFVLGSTGQAIVQYGFNHAINNQTGQSTNNPPVGYSTTNDKPGFTPYQPNMNKEQDLSNNPPRPSDSDNSQSSNSQNNVLPR